ncbi:hypothetical protein GALL_370530 [mine drainage metagenome]|uniref:Uncharacterized protein n=1 Tax=mine drainage metagenome TaxID=410659 RepID=A0A1J5QMN2_9ZZZZ
MGDIMHKTLSRHTARGTLVLALGVGLLNAAGGHADDRNMRHEHERHGMGEPYRARHWIFDDRHHHGHYYPAIGYSINALPFGCQTLGFRHRRLFFQAGVWYEPTAGGYVVVRPPIGIVVPMLPPDYSTVFAAGVPYFYANDTYYASAPGGYAVVNPPAAGTYIEAPAAPAAPAAPGAAAPVPAAKPGNATWYFCTSANAYYPYVATCKEGWKPVPASAPPNP